MDNKIHIKAVVGSPVKIGAMWHKYGDKIDCEVSERYFQDLKDTFQSYEIVKDTKQPIKVSIIEPKKTETAKVEVGSDGKLQKSERCEVGSNRKSAKTSK